ncbi:MAG: phosphoglycerate mutase family protein [Candidatus Saccharibacteria bacterium]
MTSRTVYLVRHGLSEANNRDNIGTPAFASTGAPLMELGREHARKAGVELVQDWSHDPLMPVAVSELLRTQETAFEAGFVRQKTYPILNESYSELDYPALRQLLDDGDLPAAAFESARLLLADPPLEKVWFTHGLVIAGVCDILGIADQFDSLIPRFGEIRKIEIMLSS